MDLVTEQLAIHSFFAAYCHAIDEHDLEGVRSCFTDDAIFTVISSDDEPSAGHSGRDAIAAFMSATWPDQIEQPRHFVENIVVRAISPTDAEIDAYLLLTFAAAGQHRVGATGAYHTHLSMTDGSWRIKEHTLRLD